MARRQDVTAELPQYAQIVQHLLTHLVFCPEWQDALVIHRAMEDDLASEITFQPLALHALAGPLDGIQYIYPGLNHIRNNLPDAAVIVMEGRGPVPVRQVYHSLHPRNQELPDLGRREHQVVLRAH